jgi:hypothetical protein
MQKFHVTPITATSSAKSLARSFHFAIAGGLRQSLLVFVLSTSW